MQAPHKQLLCVKHYVITALLNINDPFEKLFQ